MKWHRAEELLRSYPRLSPNLYPIKAVSLLYIGLTKTTALGRPADTVEEWN